MIKYLRKDITTVTKGVILHGCNCSGGFGSGVAGAIRNKWPKVYKEFKGNGIGEHLLGTIQEVDINSSLVVINGYTQVGYGRDGKQYADLVAVKSCILKALNVAMYLNLPLYLPKIGCGLGGLTWKEVSEVILDIQSISPFKEINVCEV